MPQTALTNEPLAFEPMQLNEKLAFLACYSHYVIALQCEHQDQQALDLFKASSDVCPAVLVQAEELPQFPAELFELIAAKFGLQLENPELGLSQWVRAEPARPLVIITGCERLNDKVLTAICGLASRAGLGLTLFSRTGLAKKLDPAVANVLHTTVKKLQSRDIKQLLHRRAQSDVRLSEADIQSVVEQSRGSVQKADGLLAELMTAERKNLGLPLAHMSMLILFIAIVIGAFMMIPSEDTVSRELAVTPTPLSGSIEEMQQVSTRAPERASITGIAQSGDVRPAQASRETTAITVESTRPRGLDAATSSDVPAQAQVSSAERVQSEAPLVESGPVVAESDVSDALAADVRPDKTPIVLETADPNAWVNRLPATSAGVIRQPVDGYQTQGEWLLAADSSAYTLQIMGSHDESRIKAFMSAHPDYEHFGYFETRHLNQPWFVLTYGRYPDRNAAVDAITRLPAPLKAQKPWARGVNTVRGG